MVTKLDLQVESGQNIKGQKFPSLESKAVPAICYGRDHKVLTTRPSKGQITDRNLTLSTSTKKYVMQSYC